MFTNASLYLIGLNTHVKINVARIIDDGEVKNPNGQALYKQLRDLYHEKNFNESSIGYLFRYANVIRYIGGRQAPEDSGYFHEIFGTYRILGHCKNINDTFNNQHTGRHHIYKKLIGDISMEEFCENFEIILLVDTGIPSAIIECCIYEALKARPNGAEIHNC